MENPVASPRVYRFEAFSLDSRTGELSHRGARTPLREQPLQLLVALLEHPGELVTREQLIRRLWPVGTFVDFDRGLNKAINHLRESLGDSAEHPHFIETFPRRGYRFIVPVTHDGHATEEAVPLSPRRSRIPFWIVLLAATLTCLGIVIASVVAARHWVAARRQPAPQISALAVIPLENLSHDPEQEYFADGVTDALITDLAKVSSVRITSRTSIIRYKATKKSISEIGRELNVDAVVEGTVTHFGNRVRITAQLIQVSTDMHLWAEAYERDATEILDLQNEVATEIARRVSSLVRPLDQARLVTPEAYGFYLKGRYFFYQYTSQGWQQSIESFNERSRATRVLRRPIRVLPTLTWWPELMERSQARKPWSAVRRPPEGPFNWMTSLRVPTTRWQLPTAGTTGTG